MPTPMPRPAPAPTTRPGRPHPAGRLGLQPARNPRAGQVQQVFIPTKEQDE